MLQWVWPVPLAIGAFLAPESPWNAIRRGNYAQARNSLMRLRAHGQNEEVSVDNTMAYMVHVTRLEQAETAGAGYVECFKGRNLRRTEIVSFDAKAAGGWQADGPFSRTVLYGLLKSCAETPFSDTPSPFCKKLASASQRPSTST